MFPLMENSHRKDKEASYVKSVDYRKNLEFRAVDAKKPEKNGREMNDCRNKKKARMSGPLFDLLIVRLENDVNFKNVKLPC